MPRDRTIRDFFGNEIEFGDDFFYGNNPPVVGRVIKLRHTSILLDIGYDKWTQANKTMNCKSPKLGICLNKIPQELKYG